MLCWRVRTESGRGLSTIPFSHHVDIHQTFLCQSRGRLIFIGDLFAPQPISTAQLTPTQNSGELFLSSFYFFHTQNGAFDLGNFSVSDIYGVSVYLPGRSTAPGSTPERRVGEGDYPFSRKIVSIGGVCLLLRLATFGGSRSRRTS